jgi:hypothetical protein
MAIMGDQGGHSPRLGHAQPKPEPSRIDALREAIPGLAPEKKDGDPSRIGLVFVHGIGSQKAGETLVSWAHPLLRLIARWSATTTGVRVPNDPVIDSQIDFGGGERGFIRARVPEHGDNPAQVWVMTEAWWTKRVTAPSVGEMFRWLFPTEMVRIVSGILSGLGGEAGGLFKVLDAIFLTIFVIPITILVFVLYLVFRLFQTIPIKALQDFVAVKAIEFFLSDWFGDVRLLIADRAQAANVRAAVAAAIQAVIDDGCGRVVMIGHSGGTIAGYMTLTDERYHELQVDRFITHGQALGLAWRLGHASDPNQPDRAIDRLYKGDRLRLKLGKVRTGTQWFDFWGTHDPAPAGGFGCADDVATPETSGGVTTRVFNRMSLRNDHGGYWDNDESFVLPVARLIDTAGKAGATSRFFPLEPTPSRIEHRKQRVKLLQFAWVGVMVSAIVAVPIAILDPLIPGDQGNIALAGELAYAFLGRLAFALGWLWDLLKLPALPPADALPGPTTLVIGIVAMLVVFYGVSSFMGSLWNSWDARERMIALQPKPCWRPTVSLSMQMGLCAGASVGLLGFAATGSVLGLLFPGIALVFAYLLKLTSPRGPVRRPGHLEVADRGEILAGAPGIGEVHARS